MAQAISIKTTGHTYIFDSPINYEHSSGFTVRISENAKSQMELFTPNGEVTETGEGVIEWVYNIGTDDEDVEHIGVQWENRELIGYDGVFELPTQAISLLGQASITVGDDFKVDLFGQLFEGKTFIIE